MMESVEIIKGIEPVVLHLRGDAGRITQVEDRIALVTEEHAGVMGGEEAAAPKGRAPAQAAAGGQDDITGEILRDAAQAVIEPGPDTGPAEERRAAVHHQLAGM